MTYQLRVAPSAARALAEKLPPAPAAAALEFITCPLLENPQRVGKALHAPLDGKWSARRGQYRVIYKIDDRQRVVNVLQIAHRGAAYR